MDFLLFLRSIKMNRPYAVHPNKNADVNLGIICDGGEKR